MYIHLTGVCQTVRSIYDRGRSVKALQLPPAYPNDRADRVIGATALVEGLALLTADEKIRKSGMVRTVW